MPPAQPAEGADARPDPQCGRRDPARRASSDDRGGRAGRHHRAHHLSPLPDREDLLNASGAARCAPSAGRPAGRDAILDLTRAAYENFDANEGIVRAIISAPEGVEVRKRPAEIRLEMLRQAAAPRIGQVKRSGRDHALPAHRALALRDLRRLDGASGGSPRWRSR